MQKKAGYKERIKNFSLKAFSIFLFTLFFVMLNPKPWSGMSALNTDGTIGYTEENWTLKREETIINPDLQLPEFMELKKGTLYTISTTITYDGTKDKSPYGFMHVDHLYCRVILDDEVLFSYMPEDTNKWDLSKSPGFIYKAFPIPQDCKGKKLEIQVLPMFTTSVEYGLPEIEFGDYISTVHHSFIKDLPHDIIVVLCIMLGFVAILFSTVTFSGADYREGLTIGIFSLLFALYLITECKINVYGIGNPYYIYLLNYTVFSLMPVAMMGFMRERLLKKQGQLCTAIITAELIFFLIEMGLHLGGILDLREMIPVIHFIYFTEVLLIIVFVTGIKDRKRKYALVSQLIPIFLGMICDGIIYWLHWEIGSNDATFTILGVIIFLIVELFHVGRSSVYIYTESIRSKIYRQMAYVDAMTGVGNRRSFDQEIERIVSKEKTYSSIIVVSADVNNLKNVNDNYGHDKGDYLICNAAKIMKEVVQDKGRIFRVGGDEFSIFLYNIDKFQYKYMQQQIEEKIEEFNEKNEFIMSVASGYVNVENNDIYNAVKEADKQMYDNKAKQKQSDKIELKNT